METKAPLTTQQIWEDLEEHQVDTRKIHSYMLAINTLMANCSDDKILEYVYQVCVENKYKLPRLA